MAYGKVTTKGLRGANMMAANPQRMESQDGKRWATGRTVRGETDRPGYFVPVDVWQLRTRNSYGQVVIVDEQATEAEARAFVGGRALEPFEQNRINISEARSRKGK